MGLHVVMFSGGISSYVAALRVREKRGTTRDLVLLFADTRIEDEDAYRFRDEAARDVGGELVIVADGRTPWELFRDKRFLGNSRRAPCSLVLKQQPLDKWLEGNCNPATAVIYTGLDWSEEHRVARFRQRHIGWTVEAPLCEAPYLTKRDMLDIARARGVRPSRAYAEGFAHDNCGGVCVKAGQGHFVTLLRARPERFAEAEAKEQELRDLLGDVSILRDWKDGGSPLPLRGLRERVEAGDSCDMFEIGGCGCAVDDEVA